MSLKFLAPKKSVKIDRIFGEREPWHVAGILFNKAAPKLFIDFCPIEEIPIYRFDLKPRTLESSFSVLPVINSRSLGYDGKYALM